MMHRSSIKSNHNQLSSQKQNNLSTAPLVNSEVGQLIGKKAQLLFPQFQVEQEGFLKGDIEQAIASFVGNLQSPQNKFDLESTMLKMRRIADEQEKKIQKSINKDNQYSEEDAFGFSSAMKYQFKAQFNSLEEQKFNNENYSSSIVSEKKKITDKFPQLQTHSQSSPQVIQQTDTKTYATPMKQSIHSNIVNPLHNSARVNGSAGPSVLNVQNTNINQAQQQHQQQSAQIQQGSNQNNISNNSSQPTSHNFPIQYLPYGQQYYQYPYPYHQNNHAIPPYSLTTQKENQYLSNIQSNFNQQYHHNYNQFNFHPLPPNHLQQQQQQQNYNGYNENQNPLVFMSAPPVGPSYNTNNSKFLPRVPPTKTSYYHQKTTQQQQYSNEQEQVKKQLYQDNNNNGQQLGNKKDTQPQQQQPLQQFQNSILPIQQQEKGFQYPAQISQQQQQPEDIQMGEQSILTLKRINSLESVQQQLNFDVVRNDDSLSKSNKMIEDSSEIRQNTNNSNNQNCIDEFLRESRISCEEEDILSNNKLTLSPSISIKDTKNDLNDFDRSMNQDSYPCELINNNHHHRIPLSDQSTMTNIKQENQNLEKLLRYDNLHKSSNFNDFMHYESNSDLNFMMEDNPIQHLNQCDFDKYID